MTQQDSRKKCVLDRKQRRLGAPLGWDDIWGGKKQKNKKHTEAGMSVAKKKGEAECSARHAAAGKLRTEAQSDTALSMQCQKSR